MLELVVIAPLIPVTVGDRYETGRIPPHLTVLPKVRVSHDQAPAVLSMLSEVAATTDPITAACTGYASFGAAGEVRVTTVEAAAELRELHRRLLEGVRQSGGVSLRPDYNDTGYRPHVTHTDGRAPRPGERIMLTAVALLDCTRPTRQLTAVASLSE